jgi:hypothetical protein
MHKLANVVYGISKIRSCEGQVLKTPNHAAKRSGILERNTIILAKARKREMEYFMVYMWSC